jgi:hypothetical protein
MSSTDMSSTDMSSTAAKTGELISDWDFEKDIENMFAESSATKPKSRGKIVKMGTSAPT